MNIKAPRGTHDLWGKQARQLQLLEAVSRTVFEKYNYTEVRMPTFEDAGLFTRSIGETTDIVEKEMYVFSDRKGRKLALRPEGTASVVRAYLENQLAQNLAVGKLYYMGSMFRYERPQAGRYREFYQIGGEFFGDPGPRADAEVILLARDVLNAAGLSEIDVRLHTLGCDACRPRFRQALKEYFGSRKNLCADCMRRMERNPLRLLDCKVDSSSFEDLPRMEEFLCEECGLHFCRVQEMLEAAGCRFHVDPRLVRGLDYYTRTVFEIRSSRIGAQDALAAGGRYDNLVQELGGNPTPSVGFALGSERVLMALEGEKSPLEAAQPVTIFIAVADKSLEKDAFGFAAFLRNIPDRAKPALIFSDTRSPFAVEGPFADKSLKSQFRLADKLGAQKVVIMGEEEHKRGSAVIRDMKSKAQEEISLSSLGFAPSKGE